MTVERFTAHVGANIREFVARMRQVDATVRDVASGADIDIRVNIREFQAEVARMRAQLAELRNGDTDINIDADTSRFQRKLLELRARLLALSRGSWNRIRVDLDVKWNKLKAAMGVLKAGYQDGQAMMGKIATSMRNFAELVSTSMTGAFMAIIPAIAPIFANIGALVGNLGVMIGVMGGQAIGFGLGAITAYMGFGAAIAMVTGNVKALYEKNAKLDAQQTKTKASIDNIKTTYQKLVKDTQKPILEGVEKGANLATSVLTQLKPLFMSSSNAFNSLMSSLKKSVGSPPIQEFIKYLNTSGAPIMKNFAKGVGNIFKGLASIFVAFAPLTKSVAKGFEDMGKSFASWSEGLKSSDKLKTFISYVQENMPKISSIFGNLILGIVNFFAAFGGSASGMMTSLQGLMKRWAEWTSQLGSNQAFQNFLSYVSSTAPTVMSLIGNLTKFLVNLGIGMAPLGAKILELVTSFLAWANSMLKSNPIIGQVLAVIISLTGVVMALLPWVLVMGSTFARILAPIKTFFTSLSAGGQRVSFFSKAIQLVSRVFGLLTGPIGIVIAIIASLIAVLVGVYKTSATFREQIATSFNAVKNVIMTAFGAVKTFIASTWAEIKSIWTDNSAQLTTIGTTVWSYIKKSVETAMTIIMTIMSVAWPLISAIIQTVWETIKNSITIAVAVIKGVISVFSAFLTGDFGGAWQALKTMVITILQSMVTMGRNILMAFKDAFIAIWQVIKEPVLAIWNGIKTGLVAIWNAIKTTGITLWTSIVTFFASVWTSVVTKTTAVWTTIKTYILTVWTSIKTMATTVWTAVKTAITTVITSIVNEVVSRFNVLKTRVMTVFNSLKPLLTNVWIIIKNAVLAPVLLLVDLVTLNFKRLKTDAVAIMNNTKTAMVNVWNIIKNAVKTSVTAVKTAVVNAWNNIKSATTTAWNNIKSAVKTAVNGVKTAVTTGFNAVKSAVKSAWSAVKSATTSAWSAIKSAVTTAISGIKSAVVNGFSAIKSAVTTAMSNVKTAVTTAWSTIKSSVTTAISSIKSAVVNGFSSLVSSVKTAMSNVVSAIKSGWDNAISYLKGIDLASIGANIISGLVNGIKSKVGEVAGAIKSIADKVTGGLRKALDIHSPSRVTKKIGEHTGQGFANGIAKKKKAAEIAARKVAAAAKKGFNDKMRGLDLKLSAGTISTATYIKQAKALAKQYSSVVNAQNTVNAKIAKASTKAAIAEQKRKHALLIAQTKTFNTKLAKLDNKHNANTLSDKAYIKKVQALAKQYKDVEAIQIKSNAKVIAAQKKADAKTLNLQKQKVTKILSTDKVITKTQLKTISDTAKLYKRGTTQRIYFENQYAKAVKQNNKVILADNKTKVDNILANESKSAVQQLAYIDKIAKSYKKGTTERAYFDKQAGKKKEEIYEGLMELNEKYTKLVVDANAEMLASEKSLNDEYDKTVASRADSLSQFTALFSEVSKTADVTASQLKTNLQDQVTTLKEWSTNINSLMSKGVNGTLLAELRELGPNASAEIAALNTMTAEELAEYQALWNEKSVFANSIALTELTELRATTDTQIKALRAETAAQLKVYNTEWQEEIKKLTGTSKKTFDAMVKSMPAIGKNVIKGMQNGLTSMTPALLAQAQSIADSIKSTIQKALDIHSPSRWGDKMIGRNLVLGIANGIDNMKRTAVKSALNLAESVKSELSSNLSVIDGLAVSNEMKQSVNKELSVKVKVEVEGNGNGLGGGVVINNQYDTRNLNESELARQQKRQLQALATNF